MNLNADETKTESGRKKKPFEPTRKRSTKTKGEEERDNRAEAKEQSGTQIQKGTESDTLNIFSALSIADSNDDAALKKLHEQIPKDDELSDGKEVAAPHSVTNDSERLKYTPQSILAGRKAVKGDYDSALSGVAYVPQSDAYADVTARVLADRAAAQEKATEPEEKPNRQKDKMRRKALRAKQQQALGDYQTQGAATDAVARNEFYLRAQNAAARKKKRLAVSILLLVALMLLTFGVSVIVSTLKGFTVNLTGTDSNKGLTLYESYDAVKQGTGVSRLSAKAFPSCDNQTFSELKDAMVHSIDKGDGEQSKEFYYFAYSFYVQNVGKGEVDYEFRLNLTATSRGVDDAVRIAFFEDSDSYLAKDNKRLLTVTGKPATDPATGEWLYRDGVPLMQQLYDPEGRLYPPDKQDNAQPFYSPATPLYRKKTGFGFKSGQNTHKYTVVIYLEGGDDDCKSSIRGGGIKFSVEMAVTDYRIQV